jgi:plasmid stabilization system protein ParE
MAFKILYHEEALADLKETFHWSREKHPQTTEQFANDLFDRIELLAALPYIGTALKGYPHVRRLLHSPLYVYYRLNENRRTIEILHFWHCSRRDPQL